MAKRITKTYDQEYKYQALKLAQEIGGHKAAEELGVPSGIIYAWVKAFKEGRLEVKTAVHTPGNALSLNEELIELRKHVKEQDKEIKRLKEENEFLEEASAFSAASRRKSAKNRDSWLLLLKQKTAQLKEKSLFIVKVWVLQDRDFTIT